MKYHLAEACQNTFILVDLRKQVLGEKILQTIHHRLLSENRDDALLITKSAVLNGALYCDMLVLGADGQLGEFCGNGARAIAAYLFALEPIGTIYLRTRSGFSCSLQKLPGDLFAVSMPHPSFTLQTRYIGNAKKFPLCDPPCIFVEMLEPHLIIPQPMSDEKLMDWGRKLNQMKEVFPLGINVNACEFINSKHLLVKTYERGVQRLTRSCGTGSASCAAVWLYKTANEGSSMEVMTPGGALKIILEKQGLNLIGPAQFEPAGKKL